MLTPFGLKPLKSLLAAPFNSTIIEMMVPVSDSTPLYINDIVKTVSNSDATGENSGIEYCARVTPADNIRGIVVGFKVIHEDENYTYRKANEYRTVRVLQDPFIVSNALVNAAILPTDVNRYLNIDSSGGNIVTGTSEVYLDYATISDIGGQFKITKILQVINNAEEQVSLVECILQRSEILEGVVSSGDLFDRIGTTIVPHTAGDDLDMGTGDVTATNAHFTGKLTVDGLIDPTGLQLTGQTTAPSTDDGLIYYNSADKRFYFRENGVWNKLTYSGTTTTTVGGIPAGTTFDNAPLNVIDDELLRPYINPAFTAFAITGVTTVEVGTKITGLQTFTWAISTVGNVQANSINITDVTSSLSLVTGHSVTSPATYNFNGYAGGGLEVDTASSIIFQITGTNTNLGTFTDTYLVHWEWLVHSGMNVNGTLTNAQILALANSSLTTVFPPQVATAGGGYFWYWIPSSFTQPTIFKDHATGFAIDMQSPITQSVTNANSIATNYRGYRSTAPLITGITVDIS